MHPRAVSLTLLLALAVPMTVHAQQGHIAVQGHRGFMSHYPENTVASFEAGFEAGADIVELDLAITSDEQVVVMHDATVDRTTDGRGPVHSFSLEEIRRLDAGSWFGASFAGERVPSLREVLELAEGRGRVNLEVKSRGRLWGQTLTVIERTIELVRELDALERVVFSSFEVRALEAVRAVEPRAEVWLIDWDEPSAFDNLDLIIHHGFDGWVTRPHLATAQRVAKAAEAGLHIHVSRADPLVMQELIALGIDQIGADDVASLVAWLQEHGYRRAAADAADAAD